MYYTYVNLIRLPNSSRMNHMVKTFLSLQPGTPGHPGAARIMGRAFEGFQHAIGNHDVVPHGLIDPVRWGVGWLTTAVKDLSTKEEERKLGLVEVVGILQNLTDNERIWKEAIKRCALRALLGSTFRHVIIDLKQRRTKMICQRHPCKTQETCAQRCSDSRSLWRSKIARHPYLYTANAWKAFRSSIRSSTPVQQRENVLS